MSEANFVQPRRSEEGGVSVVILDRVEPGLTPEYCVHGKVTCYAPDCGEWCWLGDNTYRVVASGEAAPLCQQCAVRLLPADAKPARNLGDHRRADGPH